MLTDTLAMQENPAVARSIRSGGREWGEGRGACREIDEHAGEHPPFGVLRSRCRTSSGRGRRGRGEGGRGRTGGGNDGRHHSMRRKTGQDDRRKREAGGYREKCTHLSFLFLLSLLRLFSPLSFLPVFSSFLFLFLTGNVGSCY